MMFRISNDYTLISCVDYASLFFLSLSLEHHNLYIAKSLIPLPLSYPLLPFVLAFYLASPPLRLSPADTKISDLRLNFDVLQCVSWGPVVQCGLCLTVPSVFFKGILYEVIYPAL